MKKMHKKTKIFLGAAAGVLLLGAAAILYIQQNYTIRNVIVEGNVHYTKEEIAEMVMQGKWGNNSLVLSFKYKKKDIKNIPFIETMNIEIQAKDSVKITVYEKALAGYIEYLDRYLYFDKDGIIVESSGQKTGSIPQVTGLDFGYVVLYEKLPVENEEIFQQILRVTQLLMKYGIPADKIYFDPTGNMTLYFGEARVMTGSDHMLDEKIILLKSMLPSLEGKKGELHMENYTGDSKYISFELDNMD